MLVLALLSKLCSWFQFSMLMAQSTENDPGQNCVCGWKLCVKILSTLSFWCFERTKSLFSVIVGFLVLISTVFFRFHDVFSTLFPHLPKFPSRGGVCVQYFSKPRRPTDIFLAKYQSKLLAIMVSFLQIFQNLVICPLLFYILRI